MTDPSLVPGAYNFRDVGGLPAAAGSTRRGVLYRSGSLAHLGDEGRATIASLHLRRIIDLRDGTEVERQPSLIDGLDVERLSVPVFLGSSATFYDDDLSITDMYRMIIGESRERVIRVVRGIVEDQPVLVHCTAGKDRTGVSAALILDAVGVARDAIVADYASSAQNLAGPWAEGMLGMITRMGAPTTPALVQLVTGTPPEAIEQALAWVDEHFGGSVAYLQSGGLTDAQLAALRGRLAA